MTDFVRLSLRASLSVKQTFEISSHMQLSLQVELIWPMIAADRYSNRHGEQYAESHLNAMLLLTSVSR